MHLFWLFLLLAPLIADEKPLLTPSEACGKEIELIDQQIAKLETEKHKHQELARAWQKQGDDWQYSTGNIQDGYAAWGKANVERQKAIEIQHEIDLLRARKSRIIQFFPELYQP